VAGQRCNVFKDEALLLERIVSRKSFQGLEINNRIERSIAMRRVFLIGIAWIVLAGNGFATESINQIDNYDPGNLHDLANRVALETKKGIDNAHYPSETSQIMGQAQMDFSRILIRQNDEIIRQNSEIIQLLRQLPKK